MSPRLERTQIAIVGGGPGGLVSAIAFARQGYAVTVVDCAMPPIDKACGEGLMPGCFETLRELDIKLPLSMGVPFRGVQFADERSSVLADFPNGPGLGVRRTALHASLSTAAERAGVRVLWGVKHTSLMGQRVFVEGQVLQSNFVVIADGVNSCLRKEAGLGRIKSERIRYGFRRHFQVAPWSQYVQVLWGRHTQIYITPVSSEEVCVASLSRDPGVRLAQALSEFPELKARLRHAAPASAERGGLSVTRKMQSVQRPGLALVGDASGSVDAITGEGICLAFQQGAALAECYRAGTLPRYSQLHTSIGQRSYHMAALMLLPERSTTLRRRILSAFERRHEMFAALLSAHIGQSSLRGVFASHGFDFCRSLL